MSLPTKPVAASSDDPELAAVRAKARADFGVFLAALDSRTPEQKFSVKVGLLGPAGEVEYVWLSRVEQSGDQIAGQVDNDPIRVKTVQRGDRVAITRDQVEDWAVLGKDAAGRPRMLGGLSMLILARRAKNG